MKTSPPAMRLIRSVLGWRVHALPFLLLLAVPAVCFSQSDAINERDVRLWASACAACHGTDGKSEGAGKPLAGQAAKELYQDLLDFKNAKRPATVMHQHARGYSDAELLKIAEYFSKIKSK